MATTRITPPASPCGFAPASARHRVDPMKLLALIERVRTAAGETAQQVGTTNSQPSAKAG